MYNFLIFQLSAKRKRYDDFMVYEHDAKRAVTFFEQLISRHLKTVAKNDDVRKLAENPSALIKKAFTWCIHNAEDIPEHRVFEASVRPDLNIEAAATSRSNICLQ